MSKMFNEAYTRCRALTLLSWSACHQLFSSVRDAEFVDGEIAEVGTFRGGSAMLISAAAPDRKLHVFDTFQGLPPTARLSDGYPAGTFNANEADVRDALRGLSVEFHVGFFPDTAREDLEDDVRFAFVFVDVDLEQSVEDALAYFVPRLADGGTILFDDWGDPLCPGVARAICSYMARSPLALELQTFGSEVPFALLRRAS